MKRKKCSHVHIVKKNVKASSLTINVNCFGEISVFFAYFLLRKIKCVCLAICARAVNEKKVINYRRGMILVHWRRIKANDGLHLPRPLPSWSQFHSSCTWTHRRLPHQLSSELQRLPQEVHMKFEKYQDLQWTRVEEALEMSKKTITDRTINTAG